MNSVSLPCTKAIKAVIFIANPSVGAITVIQGTVYTSLINEYVLKKGRMDVFIYTVSM